MENPSSDRPRDSLTFPDSKSQHLSPYIPLSTGLSNHPPSSAKPFVTLTFATSLDSNLSIAPGVQTALSGPESKAMTHFLRSKHDAILVGVGTAIADNPSLNCRIEGVGGYGGEGLEGQPIPVIVDPKGRWEFTEETKCMKLAKQGKGKGPLLVTSNGSTSKKLQLLSSLSGGLIDIDSTKDSKERADWGQILSALALKGVRSIMIEGGGSVINELLSPKYFHLIDSVIITVAPTWLGKGGVQVCPDVRTEAGVRVPVGRLKDVKWVPLGEDVVLCGRPKI
jgi:2,5-diamino-6-(ribosylamino)-4(3H)-pyrimidinone 5'-phosphate reductase